MLGCAFFAASPSPYMRTPQATEQYGQVLRVSVARVSLYSRTSASASPGEKPMSAKLEPTSDMPVTLKNWRLVKSDMTTPLVRRARGTLGQSQEFRSAPGTAQAGNKRVLGHKRRGMWRLLHAVAAALQAR